MSVTKLPKSHRKKSWVRLAVYQSVGGPTKVAKALEVTNQWVYKTLWAGRVPTVKMAVALSELTAKTGHPVTASQLLGLEPYVEPSGNGNGNGRRSKSRPRRARLTGTSCRSADEAEVRALAA